MSLEQSNTQSLQAKLAVLAGQQSKDTAQSQALQAQVNDLNSSLEAKDREIAQNDDLLNHDRDIRNLIGARNLYIAEIYDVAKTGVTQKPFGRVFYTKGKSLVFYAYDLDQQPGVKRASTFQAWGRRGIDQQQDVNLGIFYQDDQNKDRWILKSNDPVTLAQIDAVFVTVEAEWREFETEWQTAAVYLSSYDAQSPVRLIGSHFPTLEIIAKLLISNQSSSR